MALFWKPTINIQYVQIVRAIIADTSHSLAWDTRFVAGFQVVTTDAQVEGSTFGSAIDGQLLRRPRAVAQHRQRPCPRRCGRAWSAAPAATARPGPG